MFTTTIANKPEKNIKVTGKLPNKHCHTFYLRVSDALNFLAVAKILI